MKSKKILLFITQLEMAGAQKALTVLARGLLARGYEVHCYCFYDKTGCNKEFLELYGVKYTTLMINKSNPIQFLLAIFRLSKVLKTERFDYVQTFTHFSNIILPLIVKLFSNSKVITSQRGRVIPLGFVISKLDALVQNSKLVDKMVCVSNGILYSCVHEQYIDKNKLVVIPNGIDINKKEYSKILDFDFNDKVVYTTVARIHDQKGHDYLIEAINSIRSKLNNAIFLLVGGGENESLVREKIKELNLQDIIVCLGRRSDVDNILASSNVFILPSLWEGMPNCVLEAMKYSLPVIGTDIEGTNELIINNVTGILVPPANANELSKAILHLAYDDHLRIKMGSNGFSRVKANFSEKSYVESFDKLYCSLEKGL